MGKKSFWIMGLLVLVGCGGGSPPEDASSSPCGDFILDQIHCGSCDVVCPTGARCVEDACVCDGGLPVCDGACVDPRSNPAHCGDCGQACESGELCVDGRCGCPGGQEACGGRCVSTLTNANHCGACDAACPSGARCAMGVCQCREGQEVCDGVCTSVLDNDQHCGRCGEVCLDGTSCVEGECRCLDGVSVLCDGACANLRTDEANCGECGVACAQGATCEERACECGEPDASVCDGICVDLLRDEANCGECGVTCDPGQRCGPQGCACPAPLSSCEGACVDFNQDARHCGGCGRPCPEGQACCDGTCGDDCLGPTYDLACPEDTLIEPDAIDGTLDRHGLSFSLPPDTASYVVTAFVDEGAIVPETLVRPGGPVDLRRGDYGFVAVGAELLRSVAPVIVPQAPQFSELVEPGVHTLHVGAGTAPCRLVVSSAAPGTNLDLNFYYVGLRDLDAERAPESELLAQTMERLAAILEPLGVTPHLARHRDIEGDDATRFQIIRSQSAAFDLASRSQPPGVSRDALMSVNVFFVRGFAVPEGGLLGLSAGIPGAAGLHGTRGSGVIVALLDNPRELAQVLAHELGHYLGLFHTTEIGGQSFDPLTDTPTCPPAQWNDPTACPDFEHLMFPFANPAAVTLSPHQRDTLRANPLVK